MQCETIGNETKKIPTLFKLWNFVVYVLIYVISSISILKLKISDISSSAGVTGVVIYKSLTLEKY